MILTRVKRGAVRSHLLIKNQLANYRPLPAKRSFNLVRSLALTLFAVRLVALPIPMVSAEFSAPTSDGGEPPSMQLADSVTAAITFSPTPNSNALSPLGISISNLSAIEVGKSLATEQEEVAAAARKVAEEAALKERAVALQRQQEIKRQQEIIRQRVQEVYVAPQQAAEPVSVRELAHQMTVQMYGEDYWPAMDALIRRESNYNLNSVNRSSGACGLPQALPCSKLRDRSAEGQIAWMLNYIAARYNNPIRALEHHNLFHWY